MENKKIYTPVEVEVKNNLIFLKSINKPLNGTVEYPIYKTSKNKILYKGETSKNKVTYKDGIRHGKEYEIFKNNFNILHWENGQLNLVEKYYQNICYLKIIYKDDVKIEQHYSDKIPNYIITEEKYILNKKNNVYEKHGFWQERHSPSQFYYSRGEYKKGQRVGLWKTYQFYYGDKIVLSPSDFLKHRSDSLALTLYRKNGLFHMRYSVYKYGMRGTIIVGNEEKGKRFGWWYWFSVKKISVYFSNKDFMGNDLEKLWTYWKLKPKDELPENLKKLLFKKKYYKLTD